MKAGSEACSSAASPTAAANAQIAWPAETPKAVRIPARRPPASVFRIVSAVSCPGVTISSTATPRKARSGPTAYRRAGSGVSSGSTCSRRCSNAGGSERRSPRCSTGSSVANPGPMVAISKSTPLGSRK